MRAPPFYELVFALIHKFCNDHDRRRREFPRARYTVANAELNFIIIGDSASEKITIRAHLTFKWYRCEQYMQAPLHAWSRVFNFTRMLDSHIYMSHADESSQSEISYLSKASNLQSPCLTPTHSVSSPRRPPAWQRCTSGEAVGKSGGRKGGESRQKELTQSGSGGGGISDELFARRIMTPSFV